MEELSEVEVKDHEKSLLEKADNHWVSAYGKQVATDVNKLRYVSRQGLLNSFEQQIRDEYFRKKGLWHDGKTTLEERKVQLENQKAEFGKKIAQIRDSKLKSLDNIIKKTKDKKEQLQSIPKRLKEQYKIEKEKILENLIKELETYFQAYPFEKDIQKEVDLFTKKIESRKEEMIAETKKQIDLLQKRQKAQLESEINSFSAELEAELQILEYVEEDDSMTRQYSEEIRKINQEINQLEEAPKAIESYTCTKCGKDCKNKSGLTSHSKTHDNELKVEV